MPLAIDRFLPNPAAIKRALRAALKGADKLDMAVAFVGKDWRNILGDFKGATRLVCWLSSTNTDPRAVEQMKARHSCKVRQLDAMHAKVYLPRSLASVAIVGSANLSARALADEGTSLQFEAAVLVRQQSIVREASEWFEARWEQARPVTKANLAAAKESWDAARRVERARRVGKPQGAAAAATDITAEEFFEKLIHRPGGESLVRVAQAIRGAASKAGLDVRWNPGSFSVYSNVGADGVGLFVVELHPTMVHFGVWRWYASEAKKRRIDALVVEVMGAEAAQLSPQGNQYSFRLEALRDKEERLVVGLADIAKG